VPKVIPLANTNTTEVGPRQIVPVGHTLFTLYLPFLFADLFWKSPELLRNPHVFGSQKGDVYAFAIILYEIIGRRGPFGSTDLEPKQIIELVKNVPCSGEEPFRPDLECIIDAGDVPDYVVNCIRECWDENMDVRPDFPTIR
jgi:hypothetical protein